MTTTIQPTRGAFGSFVHDAEAARDQLLHASSSHDQSTEENTNFIAQKNMLLKFDLLTKLGMGSKAVKSMTKDSFKRMSFMYEADRRESFNEDDMVIEHEEEIHSSYSNAEGDFSLNFFMKTHDEARNAYLHKLINMKILRLQPSKKHQEIIILDWDDTLLCTSYLARYGLACLPEEILEYLKTLDETVSALLEKVTSFGTTLIITNAQEGWVASTGGTFLPKSYKIIEEKVEVISARADHEERFPEDRYRWKTEAFLGLRKRFSDETTVNIVCVGDSRNEIEAARHLGEHLENALVKTIKFKNNPNVVELIKQINLLKERFEHIITSRTHLTIRLEKKANQ